MLDNDIHTPSFIPTALPSTLTFFLGPSINAYLITLLPRF
jgi:hypothetical protein